MSHACTVVCINATSGDLIIDGDPNWDDQQLHVDGTVIDAPYTSPAGQAVTVSVDGFDAGGENMMGVWFIGPNNDDENRNNFMMTIGQDPNHLMSITDVTTLDPMTITYTVVDQTAWVLVLKFEDA